jgi:hypothetical protein
MDDGEVILERLRLVEKQLQNDGEQETLVIFDANAGQLRRWFEDPLFPSHPKFDLMLTEGEEQP